MLGGEGFLRNGESYGNQEAQNEEIAFQALCYK